jgi:hypothetical protein
MGHPPLHHGSILEGSLATTFIVIPQEESVSRWCSHERHWLWVDLVKTKGVQRSQGALASVVDGIEDGRGDGDIGEEASANPSLLRLRRRHQSKIQLWISPNRPEVAQ